jgi:hypothetical protein
VVASIEGESNSLVSIVFAGNTKLFSSYFDLAGIGRKEGAPLSPKDNYPEWFRVLNAKSIAEPAHRGELLELFGSKVLQGSPVFIRIKKIPAEDKKSCSSWTR